MKKYLRDPLGRPIPRLFYEDLEELDRECEQIIREFMERCSGGFRLLIPTDEVTRLIEEEADALDLYADLPEGVDGLPTSFPTAARTYGSPSVWPPRGTSIGNEPR